MLTFGEAMCDSIIVCLFFVIVVSFVYFLFCCCHFVVCFYFAVCFILSNLFLLLIFILVIVYFCYYFCLICAGINIAVQGSYFTVANEVVHPNFQVSTSLEVLRTCMMKLM